MQRPQPTTGGADRGGIGALQPLRPSAGVGLMNAAAGTGAPAPGRPRGDRAGRLGGGEEPQVDGARGCENGAELRPLYKTGAAVGQPPPNRAVVAGAVVAAGAVVVAAEGGAVVEGAAVGVGAGAAAGVVAPGAAAAAEPADRRQCCLISSS